MSLNEWIVLGCVFTFVWSISFSLIYRAVANNRRMRERLKAADPAATLEEPQRLLLGELTPGLADQVPMTPEARSDIQKELMAAGFYRSTAVMEYAAVRTLLVLLPLVASGVLALFIPREHMLPTLIGGLVGAMLGFSMPRLFLKLRSRWRAREIERGLPIAVDMLTLCLTAGQNVLQGLQRVGNDVRFANKTLAQELAIVCQQAELRSLQQALHQFGERVQVPEARNLAMILVQSERLGTDAGATLLEYANNLRMNARQRADAKANQTMFWMLFPTLLCLWIPAGIVLIGPAVLEFQYYRRTHLEQWRQSRREMQELQQATQAPPTTPEEGAR